MQRAITYIIVVFALGASLKGAERKTWRKIRYTGGTTPVKTSPYDWNTTLTVAVNPGSITVAIAPAKVFSSQQMVRLKPSQVVSLSSGAAALRRVAEVSGAQVPAKAPTLFGLLQVNSYLGIVYMADDGKPGALLLDSYQSWQILLVLKELTGKTIEADSN